MGGFLTSVLLEANCCALGVEFRLASCLIYTVLGDTARTSCWSGTAGGDRWVYPEKAPDARGSSVALYVVELTRDPFAPWRGDSAGSAAGCDPAYFGFVRVKRAERGLLAATPPWFNKGRVTNLFTYFWLRRTQSLGTRGFKRPHGLGSEGGTYQHQAPSFSSRFDL